MFFLKDKVKRTIAVIFFIAIAISLPYFAQADTFGQKTTFSIDKNYDADGRDKTTASLQRISEKAYFYIDDLWWSGLTSDEKAKMNEAFEKLGQEFSSNIHPKLTSTFGSEALPGMDLDERVTILIHPMIKEAGGYFNSGDGYSKKLVPASNEREIVYLNAKYIDNIYAKAYLAHEFLHIITFNQKERLRNVSEESWLNEARADYTSTFLGYDDEMENSNLDQRIRDFTNNPSNSLTEWQNEPSDYGAVGLFIRYLADHYGERILVDSLKSDKIGIPSLNYALQKNGYNENFSKVFSDWLVTLLVNDCSLNDRYCYKNQNLKNFKISPKINYLPSSSAVTLSVTYYTTYYAGNWQRIIGGEGDLSLEFSASDRAEFSTLYILCSGQGICEVKDLTLEPGEAKKGNLNIEDFAKNYSSLTIIPFIGGKISGFDGKEEVFSYSFKIATSKKEEPKNTKNEQKDEDAQMEKMLEQIDALKKEIARVQALLAAKASQAQTTISCQIKNDLYYGLAQNSEVRCLQEFLSSQGKDIYPEGIVSGNFYELTRAAAVKFQEKYASEILKPLNLKSGTGFVGQSTRAKITQLMK